MPKLPPHRSTSLLFLSLGFGLACAAGTPQAPAPACQAQAASPGWRHGVTLHGVAFARARTEANGLVIGWLEEDAVVRERPCHRGWLHLHPNGVPAFFNAAQAIDFGKFKVPAGTWIRQNPEGLVTSCAFPGDQEIQGHLCQGTGGPKGVGVAFYPSGALKQYFLRRDTVIQGVPCKSGVLRQSIQLYENGKLEGCTLSAPLEREGQHFPRGARIHLDEQGRIRE